VLSRFGLDQAETLKAMLREMIAARDEPADSVGPDGAPDVDDGSQAQVTPA